MKREEIIVRLLEALIGYGREGAPSDLVRLAEHMADLIQEGQIKRAEKLHNALAACLPNEPEVK